MLQRPQTLFMLLAFACLALGLVFPWFSTSLDAETTVKLFPYQVLTEGAHVESMAALGTRVGVFPTLLAVLYGMCLALIIGTVFQYKKRPLQIRLLALANVLIITAVGLGAYIFHLAAGTGGTAVQSLDVGVLVMIAAPIFNILAINNIRKDERLVRSMDRLR